MSKKNSMNVGILGGSFDTGHRGHLVISKSVIKTAKLHKLYWVITKRNPFKNKTFFTLDQRIFKLKKMIKNTKKIKILYIEKNIKSNRSIDTVKYILRKKRPKNLFFIIGSDILFEIHKWKSWKKLVKLTKLIVFYRKGYVKKIKNTVVVKYLNKNKINFIKNKPIPISSTMLRKKLLKLN